MGLKSRIARAGWIGAPSTEGGPRWAVLKLAAPLVLSFWMRSLFSLVDTVYAAMLGDAAVAAVGLAIPLEFLMIAFWVGLSTGLTSTLSRAIGAGEDRKVEQCLRAGRRIVGSLIPLFLILGIGVFFGAQSLGLDERVARQFAIYGGVLVAGSAISSFWSVIPDSVVKAHHDTRSTMWAGIWSNVINLVLNTVFLFVFHWGVFGIALSTVLGRFGGLAYAMKRAGALEAERKATKSAFRPEREARPLKAILSLAVPSAMTYVLMAMESSLVNGLLATLDHATEAIAAYSIYFRVVLFCLMPIIATSVAMLPYVARRFGRNDPTGIRHGLNEAMLASAGYCVFLVAPTMGFAAPFVARALAESAVTAQFTMQALWAVPVACLAGMPFFLVRPTFEGMQRGRPGLAMALLRYVLLTVPLAYGGARAAVVWGLSSFMGLLAGLIAAAAVTSGIALVWARVVLRGLGPAAAGSTAEVVSRASEVEEPMRAP
ncbi:MAG: MATE family efflux transporter [Acidobacteriota bacterium]